MLLIRSRNKLHAKKNQFQTKALNGICSTAYFSKALARARGRADRIGMPCTLVSFEIQTADLNSEYVEYLAKVICSRMRTTDEVGWLDHQHIGLLLFNTGRKGGWRLVEDIIAKIPIPKCDIYIYPHDNQNSNESNDNGQGNRDQDIAQPNGNNPRSPVKYIAATDGSSDFNHASSLFWQSADCPLPVQDMKQLFPRKIPTWKRLMDIFGALLGFIIFSPIFILTSLLIKSVSPGPVFFKQERVGCGGQKFIFYKFRTMKANVDTAFHRHYLAGLINSDTNNEKPMLKLDDHNSEIIPCGKILRKTYLDELPQLINVLRGEMSLVGPRPPIPYETDEYQSWHNGRFDIVPGMTGLWQISGKNHLTFNEMIKLDIQYSRNLSFMSDLKILLSTPVVIISGLISAGTKIDMERSINT